MESLYYVMTWLCHRTCPHCYEDRFRPYYGEALEAVVGESRRNHPRIIANLPERMTYLDPTDPRPDGSFPEKPGRIILAGGEILLEPVRETVLYPGLELLSAKYHGQGLRLIVQTTGDLVTERIVEELLARGVSVISVSGMDSYHKGLEKEELRRRLQEKLQALFEKCGMRPQSAGGADGESDAPAYHFFGATPDSWIGPLWPRGRARENGLTRAALADNFCNRWSGGLNFLARRYGGSEVSIEPNGNVYPCCIKTKAPVGNVIERPLDEILDALVGDPVYEAISMGHPERMGLSHGWSVEQFYEKSRERLPDGTFRQNLCLGCDRFHEEVLIPRKQRLVQLPAAGSCLSSQLGETIV